MILSENPTCKKKKKDNLKVVSWDIMLYVYKVCNKNHLVKEFKIVQTTEAVQNVSYIRIILEA